MTTEFSALTRQQAIQKMKENEFDLVVIGGGVTGAGVARDASSRGMTVALIEAQDFAQGTSSRSSKLIHGGIRYLENLEFHLVFEALSERRILFEIAPHLVHPLRFVLPLYQGWRVGMFKMGLGMWLYDALSMFEAPELHERLSTKETMARLPLLKSAGLAGSFAYSDAYMDDDRLVIETLRSAATQGALCASRVQAVGARHSATGKVEAIECQDRLSGDAPFVIRGKHFVSTVGPWTDSVAQTLLPTWKKVLRPSKGIHLTFESSRLPLSSAIVMAADQEKRIVFGIPRHEMIIIGTTDTDYKGDPADVSASADDVRYLLNVAEEYFPGAHLQPQDIVSSYSGIRPLVDDGAETESKTSREHLIYDDPRNITFVAGGKYTTYRLMAEQSVESALLNFSLEDQVRFRKSQTKIALNPLATIEKIAEAHDCVGEWSRQFKLSPEILARLVERHGEEAFTILQNGSDALKLGRDEEKLWALEAQHAIRNTMCLSLLDFYTRRSPLFLARRDHGLTLLQGLSDIFQAALGWSDSRAREERTQVQAYVQKELAWKNAFGLAL
jgi:glycerol-3-phosphate dehydrogenase